MKYIRLYESFETDLEDILLDITDLGYRYTIDNGYTANDYNTISIENTKDSDFNIILDCALRLKDFLGDRYVSCYYYQIGYGWKKFNLEEGCNIKFWHFIMYLKIFYRSDLQSLYSWGGKKVNEMHHRFNDKLKSLRTQDIKDCFLELEDSGFIIKVYFNKSFSSHVTGSVTITKERINGFLPMFMLDDLKEVLLFAIPYLQENYYLDVKYAIYSKHGSCGRYRNLETLNKINPSIYNFTWDFSVPDNIKVDGFSY